MSRPLYQALLSLDHHTFELLITQLLKARYPNVDIQHIDGKSGDTGLDIITGELDDQPTIWQCKHFSSIKKGQKEQIKESLNQALKHYTPIRWILCIPIDMEAPTLRWFQHLTSSRADRTELKLYAANDIVRELLYRHSIREQFFPGITANFTELREIVMKTSGLNDQELLHLTEGNAQSFLARLEERDARFTYEVTIGRNRPPSKTSQGEVLTISSGDIAIRVFPRDIEALRQNPLKGIITLKGTGVEKLRDVERFGRPQQFTAEELVDFTSDLDHLLPQEREGMTLQIVPHAPNDTIPLKVTFGTDEHADIYDYILFQRTRAGTEEAELQSATPLPFRITLRLGKNGGGVTFTDKTKGADVESTLRQVRAIINAIKTGSMTFYNLEKSAIFVRARFSGPVPEWLVVEEEFLVGLKTIATAYGVPLRVPTATTDKDFEAMEFLTRLLTGVDLPASECDVELVQNGEPDAPLREMLTRDVTLRIDKPMLPEEQVIFGTAVPTGPIRYSVAKARFKDPQTVTDFLDKAPIGATMHAVLSCDGPIHLERLTEATNS